jgi:hypothetical protein
MMKESYVVAMFSITRLLIEYPAHISQQRFSRHYQAHMLCRTFLPVLY